MRHYPIFKKVLWLDTSTMQEKFGIMVKNGTSQPWLNLAEDSRPCIYDSEETRNEKIEELRALSKAGTLTLHTIRAEIGS